MFTLFCKFADCWKNLFPLSTVFLIIKKNQFTIYFQSIIIKIYDPTSTPFKIVKQITEHLKIVKLNPKEASIT